MPRWKYTPRTFLEVAMECHRIARRRLLLQSICGLIAAACLLFARPASATAQTSQAKPNIVFLLIDDMGWRDVGCTGSDFYETPNVDRLASQGMRFTQAYT